MKTLYAGFLNKSADQLDDIWKDALITFDTNVLLNLYSYSEEARDNILDLIEKLKDRCFLTHRAGFEFHRKRRQVILDVIDKHNESLGMLNKYKNELTGSSSVPHLSNKLLSDFTVLAQSIESEINENKEKYKLMSNVKDIILNRIHDSLGETVSEPYDEKRLQEIYKDGAKRYESSIPPGFTDKAKSGNEKYGDLLIWMQIIDKAKADKRSVIFITDEKKPDWWWQSSNKNTTFGPQPHLIDEFYKDTNQLFQLYSTKLFLTYANKYLQSHVSTTTIQEVENNQLELQRVANNQTYTSTPMMQIVFVISSASQSVISPENIFRTSILEGFIIDNIGTEYDEDYFKLVLLAKNLYNISRLTTKIKNMGYNAYVNWSMIGVPIREEIKLAITSNRPYRNIEIVISANPDISNQQKTIRTLIASSISLNNHRISFTNSNDGNNNSLVTIEDAESLSSNQLDTFLESLYFNNIPAVEVNLR